MDDLWKVVLPALVEYGAPVVVAALSAVATMAFDAMRKHFKGEAASRLLDRLERVTSLAVHDIEQTMLPAFKAAAKDGKITRGEAEVLRVEAIKRVKKLLGGEGVKQLDASTEDLDEVIGHVIEAKVRELRVRQSHAPPLPTGV